MALTVYLRALARSDLYDRPWSPYPHEAGRAAFGAPAPRFRCASRQVSLCIAAVDVLDWVRLTSSSMLFPAFRLLCRSTTAAAPGAERVGQLFAAQLGLQPGGTVAG